MHVWIDRSSVSVCVWFNYFKLTIIAISSMALPLPARLGTYNLKLLIPSVAVEVK